MKKVHFLSAALMALALTACNDDPVGDKNPLGPAGSTEGEFIGITITNSANYGSRAEGDDDNVTTITSGYITGTADENFIDKDKLHFLFFDRLGNPFTMQLDNNYADGVEVQEATNWVKPLNLVDDTGVNTGHVATGGNDDKTKAVLLLGKSADLAYQGIRPSRIVCLANIDDAKVASDYANKSIAELMEELSEGDNAPLEYDLRDDKGHFLMTSSTYFDGTNVVCWSDITAANFCSTPEDAVKAPVQIYIERLAAKVSVNQIPTDNKVKAANGTDPLKLTYHYIDKDGKVTLSETSEVLVKTTGWMVNDDHQRNYGIKHLMNGKLSSSYFKEAKDFNAGVRSFWASTSSLQDVEQFIPADFKKAENGVFTADNKPRTEYIFANTCDPFLEGEDGDGVESYRTKVNFARSYATKVLVGAEIYVVPEGTEAIAEDAEPTQLMLWAGNYYTPEALCKILYDGRLTDEQRNEGFVVCYARAVTRTQNIGHCNVKFYITKTKANANKDVTKADGTRPDGLTALNEKTVPAALYWNGMCYYILNIDNNTICTKGDHDGDRMYGVVRNTAYVYNLNYFVGLGTPVTNPEIPTEPENPSETDGYVAAKLNVLDWRVVTNSTILQ